ncbi:MAG: hypothetical protein KAH77_02855, partial [Thiomargarita sp.]|nr:hypothetical protein [Thiomargarita sp.]
VVIVSPIIRDNSQLLEIVNPVGQALAKECQGNDHSAIRRIALRTEIRPDISGELPFIQAAEQTSEIVRQRAINQFSMELPIFPPALRIALSHPDAFRSFSLAYQAGHILKNDTTTDNRGSSQWMFSEQRVFLTFGKASSLADAAANYHDIVKTQPMTFTPCHITGDFSQLDTWQNVGGKPENEDVFVLIAMRIED